MSKHDKRVRVYKKKAAKWRPWIVAVPINDVTMDIEHATFPEAIAYAGRLTRS